MLSEQLSLLYPVVTIFLALTILMLYVYYTSDRHYRIKLLLGPALLSACVFTVPYVGASLGYGWPAPLPVSFQYIAHRTVIVRGEKQWIDVFLTSRKPLGKAARLHRIRWTGSVEQVLDEAQRMKEGPGGGEIVVTGPAGAERGGDGNSGYSALRVLPQDQNPKAMPPAPRNPGPGPRQERRPLPTDPFEFLV